MPRVPRAQQRAASVYCHIMNRGHNRETVFQTDDDYLYFLELLDCGIALPRPHINDRQ